MVARWLDAVERLCRRSSLAGASTCARLCVALHCDLRAIAVLHVGLIYIRVDRRRRRQFLMMQNSGLRS
jgi:hypothetical protein